MRPILPLASCFGFDPSQHFQLWSWRLDFNQRSPDYKSDALNSWPRQQRNIRQRATKKPALWAGFLESELSFGFYPPPPRPGFVAMMVQPTCQGVNTNIRCGLSCRSHRASGLGNLNILNSEPDNLILSTSWNRNASKKYVIRAAGLEPAKPRV